MPHRTKLEVLYRFESPVTTAEGGEYLARAYGERGADGMWHGWLAFFSSHGSGVAVTDEETSQLSEAALIFWASRLNPPYLEGALQRARSLDPKRTLSRLRERLEQDRHVLRRERELLEKAEKAREQMRAVQRVLRGM